MLLTEHARCPGTTTSSACLTTGTRCARKLTSLLAEYFQIEYVTAPIPAMQMAVLAFQFEGRVHQPPGR